MSNEDPKKFNLQQVIDILDKTMDQVRNIFATVNESQTNWKPSPEVWNMGQIMQHIVLWNKEYLEQMDKILAKADPSKTFGKYKPNIISNLIFSVSKPGSKVKLKAPKQWQPEDKVYTATVYTDLLESLNHYKSLLIKSKHTDLNSLNVQSPAISWLRMKMGTALILILLHTQRHIWQASKLHKMPEFPKD